MTQQLLLDVRLQDGSSFENFYPAGNAESLNSLLAAIGGLATAGEFQLIFLWGRSACGKTHLLQAACRQAQEQVLPLVYLPMKTVAALGPSMIEDMEQSTLVCIDDIDAIAGEMAWEQALFSLCERLMKSRALLLVSAAAAPSRLPLVLADLASRLSSGLTYQLSTLSDVDKQAALRLRAHNRGITLTEEVVGYLMQHYPRDLTVLFGLLDRIDTVSLTRQRRVTIPFIRELESSAKPTPG